MAFLHEAGYRITPACAGKTRAGIRSIADRQDHPRLRGKDLLISLYMLYAKGSPPLARERLRCRGNVRIGKGITPACAGKTLL